jgi:hypothetical protein
MSTLRHWFEALVLTMSKVTLGLVLGGALPPLRGLFLLPAQLLAAMSAGGLVQCMFPGNVAATNTSLSPDTSIAQGVFIEAFMTAELVFVVLMLAAEKSKDTFIAPIGIGLALFVAMMGGMSPYLSLTHAIVHLELQADQHQVSSTPAARSTPPAVSDPPSHLPCSPATTGYTGSGPALEPSWLPASTASLSSSTTSRSILDKTLLAEISIRRRAGK